MKQETNNEMDLLLRRLARRSTPVVSEAGSHLDADELSAYAENALPAAARARYTEHLADCSSCRALVVQLSSAAGVVAAAAPQKVVEPAGWRKFLASLFSPMVLRYAGPALGLIVVAVIGVVVLRRDQQPDANVAQLREETQTAPAPVEKDQTKGFTDTASPTPSTSIDSVEANKELGRINAQAEKSAAAKPVTKSGADTGAAAEPPAPVTREEQQPSETVAVANSTAVIVTDSAPPKNEVEKRKQEAEVTVKAGETADKSFEAKPTERKVESLPMTANSPRSRGITAAPSAGAGSNIQIDGVDDRKEKSKDDDGGERRSVGGRTFRRQGGIWVDTAYEAPRNTTNLSRGSEHFRSLIADEPAIKTIADQLGSEFIVVWKGRAYRIR